MPVAIYRIPIATRYLEKRRVRGIYRDANRAAAHYCAYGVRDSGWAMRSPLGNREYQTLILELGKIDVTTGVKLLGAVHSSLHWSRRYEYPYAIMNALPHEPSMLKILDCGAGLGPLQFYLAMKGCEVWSLDDDPRKIKEARRLGSSMKLTTLHPTCGSILRMPFPDCYFDRVLAISVLEHVVYGIEQDTHVILKGIFYELVRVVKEGGLVIITFDVSLNPKSDRRLYYHEYESLCEILGISSSSPPRDALFSSDTPEGRMMGEDLAVYCVTLARD